MWIMLKNQDRLLVIILSINNNIQHIARAIKSVVSQRGNIGFQYDILLIINTLCKNFEIVHQNFARFRVIEGELPNMAKGYNTALQLFEEYQYRYDYLTVLLSDDLFYPMAFERMNEYSLKYDADIMYVLNHDHIQFQQFDTNQHYCVSIENDPFKLWTGYGCRSVPLNPFEQNINLHFQFKIILCSANIFSKKIALRFAEDLPLYANIIPFCIILEGECNNSVKSLGLDDFDIYLSNTDANVAATATIVEEFQTFQYKYGELFPNARQWNLSQLPRGVLDKSSDFTLTSRIAYCKHHIVDFEHKQTQKQLQMFIQKFNKIKLEKNDQQEAYLNFVKQQILKYLMKYYQYSANDDPKVLNQIYKTMMGTCGNNNELGYQIAHQMFHHYGSFSFLRQLCRLCAENLSKNEQFRYFRDLLQMGKETIISPKQFPTIPEKPIVCVHHQLPDLALEHNEHFRTLCNQLKVKSNVIALSKQHREFRIKNNIHHMHETDFIALKHQYCVHAFIIFENIFCVLDTDLSSMENVYLIINAGHISRNAAKLLANYESKLRYVVLPKNCKIQLQDQNKRTNCESIIQQINQDNNEL